MIALVSKARFSALQRAENSSIAGGWRVEVAYWKFQCSSASRKFLNRKPRRHQPRAPKVSVLFSEPKIPQSKKPSLWWTSGSGFSALQRAENSSMPAACGRWRGRRRVSVLFSEPKIPQYAAAPPDEPRPRVVSVLFSEPKIPQCQS